MSKSENSKQYEIHVISQTHWDREWRYSFQKNRMYLIDMMDQMMEILENDKNYRFFHLDSQTIPLEDYLAVKPENRKRIEKLVKSGRLLVGPWYCLPDEFLVSGESLVRNLLVGHRIAKEFGAPMKVGYSPFSWGQISQLPQLYAGFGIDSILFYRGVSSTQAPKSEFIWEGADGTKALTSRFASWPRYNFWYFIYRRALYNRGPGDRDYRWTEGGLPFKVNDLSAGIDADYEMLDQVFSYNNENLKQWCNELIDMQKDEFGTNQIAWMNGHDSSSAHPYEPRLVADCQKVRPNDKVTHSSFPQYIEKLKSTVKNLKTVKGEMRYVYRTPSMSVLYGYVTSARIYLKQLNTATERKLQGYAEPFASVTKLLGDDYPKGFLDMSWKWLLENHGHDAIGGCSVDGVHEDMVYRYRQSSEISQNVLYKSFQNIVRRIDTLDRDKDSIFLVAFNPLPFPKEEILTPQVDIPASMPWKSLSIKDATTGQEVPVQIQSIESTYPVMQTMADTPMMFSVKRATLHFPSGLIPAMGYKVYEVIRKDSIKRNHGTMVTAPNEMENDYLKVTIQSNGSVTLEDKITGNFYHDLNYFEDRGEAGNPWVTKPPYFDKVFTSLSQNAEVTLLEQGAIQTIYQVKWVLQLPETLNHDYTRRTDTTKPVEIISRYILRAGAKRLDIETTVNNTVEYHRLRACFPTNVEARYHYADGQFDVLKRAIDSPDDSTWNEPEMKEKPQNNFVVISSNDRSMAILNDGIKEYEVQADKQHTIALTLLRSFSIKIDLLGEGGVDYRDQMKGSQCLGLHTYKYSVYPHKGHWEKAGVMDEALAFNYPSRLIQCGKATHKGSLPATEYSFMQIPKPLILSALKQAESGVGLVLRIYNPTEKAVSTTIKLCNPIKQAFITDMEENPLKKATLKSGNLLVELNPKKIGTYHLVF